MLMDSIVPVEEFLAECPGILDRSKSLRKSRGIFQAISETLKGIIPAIPGMTSG
jgi:hypothetical protein